MIPVNTPDLLSQVSRAVLSTILEGSVRDLQDAAAVAIAREVAALFARAEVAAAAENRRGSNSSEAVSRVLGVHGGEVIVRLLRPDMLPQVSVTA